MKSVRMAAGAAERALLGGSLLALAALILGLILTTPAYAAGGLAGPMSGAEKLRRLDIMLMVTGLRCRRTPDNFTVEYGEFTSSHLSELNDAAAELRGDLARFYGQARAGRALDQLSTVMANGYGQGHPWLTCAELGMVAHNLAAVRGRATLEEAADQLLQGSVPPRFAYARR